MIALRQRHPLASVLFICVLAWLPGFFTLPPLDRDESRFAQATKQMLESHDYIDIKLGTGARYEKPVGIYWLQAASTATFGFGDESAIWTYRIPSFLGALAAVAATFWLARAFAGAETAFNASLILGLSVLLMSEAKIAKTDAVLLACVTAAQAVLMRVYLRSGSTGLTSPLRGEPVPDLIGDPKREAFWGGGESSSAPPSLQLLLFGWAAFGLGVLIKGPVVAIVCAATIVTLVIADRDWRWLKQLRPGPGLAVAIAIVLPWAIAIGIASHGAFYEKSLGHDFALKLVGEQETHGAPPGYYTILSALTFWPGTLLLIPALAHAWRKRHDPPTRFLLAWAASTWGLFELVPTKLPHYVLPAYPALAVLCAMALSAWKSGVEPVPRIAARLSLLLFALVGIALAVFVAVAPIKWGNGTPWWLYGVATVALFVVMSVVPPAFSNRPGTSLTRAGLAAILVYAIAGFATVPRLSALWLSPRIAAAVARHSQPDDAAVVSAGYSEPSIQFLLGTGTSLEDGAAAARKTGATGGLALVSDDQKTAFISGLAATGARADALESIAGLNYSRGRETRITLYRVLPHQQQ